MEVLREKVKRVSSTVLADLGVPMPPGMVLSKSARWVIPMFKDLAVKERKLIAIEHDKINKKALIAFGAMHVIMLVILVVSIWKPSYASPWLRFWFSVIYYLCTVVYLCWLRKKELALEKYRVEIAELVLKQRKRLPMVEVDNVEADQPANDLINICCYMTTMPLDSILNTWIYFAALNGTLGIVFCGQSLYHWNVHILLIFVVAVNVINWICFGRSFYYWRKLPVEGPPPG